MQIEEPGSTLCFLSEWFFATHWGLRAGGLVTRDCSRAAPRTSAGQLGQIATHWGVLGSISLLHRHCEHPLYISTAPTLPSWASSYPPLQPLG